MTWPRQTGANEPDKTGAGLWRRIAPATAGSVWMAVLLGALAWLDRRDGGIFLVPPFAATTSILLYLPRVPIAQPTAIVAGCTLGAAIGTMLSLLLGFGPDIAVLGALAALMTLPLVRAYHPPGVALAMYAPLLHPGLWFPVEIVLPFTLCAVGSAALMSRLLPGWPHYPSPPVEAAGYRGWSRL
jgi:CBS-domain-containing membrane protein